MAQDCRNLGLVGTTDGVPLFDDQQRGAWPFVQRVANLPDHLAMSPQNVHLHLFSANEYWELDETANCLRRKVRGPKTLKPHLMVIADDMRRAYYEGVPCVDSTIAPALQGHRFHCKVCQLLWTGDFPAQCKVTGSHTKTCHWCHFKSDKFCPEINRRVWGGFRSYLPADDPDRRDVKFGAECLTTCPAHRTHEDHREAALSQEAYLREINPNTGKPLPKVGFNSTYIYDLYHWLL